MMVVLVVLVMMMMMPLPILRSSRGGRRGDVEGLHGEEHLPCQRDGAPVAEQAFAAGAAAGREGESGEPQEEDDEGGGGGARSSHGHRAGRLQARSGVMDDGCKRGGHGS